MRPIRRSLLGLQLRLAGVSERMSTTLAGVELRFPREAIRFAEEAERRGSLPAGTAIALDGEIVALGVNWIWRTVLALTRRGEMEALSGVPPELWLRSGEMTLSTTLEPCVMCAGAIPLHGIGPLLFGAVDPLGSVGAVLGSLPPRCRRPTRSPIGAAPCSHGAWFPLRTCSGRRASSKRRDAASNRPQELMR